MYHPQNLPTFQHPSTGCFLFNHQRDAPAKFAGRNLGECCRELRIQAIKASTVAKIIEGGAGALCLDNPLKGDFSSTTGSGDFTPNGRTPRTVLLWLWVCRHLDGIGLFDTSSRNIAGPHNFLQLAYASGSFGNFIIVIIITIVVVVTGVAPRVSALAGLVIIRRWWFIGRGWWPIGVTFIFSLAVIFPCFFVSRSRRSPSWSDFRVVEPFAAAGFPAPDVAPMGSVCNVGSIADNNGRVGVCEMVEASAAAA
jgi:hypothetical protein